MFWLCTCPVWTNKQGPLIKGCERRWPSTHSLLTFHIAHLKNMMVWMRVIRLFSLDCHVVSMGQQNRISGRGSPELPSTMVIDGSSHTFAPGAEGCQTLRHFSAGATAVIQTHASYRHWRAAEVKLPIDVDSYILVKKRCALRKFWTWFSGWTKRSHGFHAMDVLFLLSLLYCWMNFGIYTGSWSLLEKPRHGEEFEFGHWAACDVWSHHISSNSFPFSLTYFEGTC